MPILPLSDTAVSEQRVLMRICDTEELCHQWGAHATEYTFERCCRFCGITLMEEAPIILDRIARREKG